MFRIVFGLLLILLLVPANSVLASPSISISPTSGAPSITTITVSGSDFTADTSVTIKFGDNIVGNATTSDGGSWTKSFVVPKSPQGSHVVEAGGLSATFTVTSRTSLSTNKGKVGSQITVTGDGYAASQSGINISFDDEQMNTVAASSLGSFTSSFTVPPRPKGDYSVIVGSSLQNFELGSAFSMSPTAGPPGVTVELLGSGFTPNANGSASITFDGNVVVSTSMDSQGSISTSFQIPVAAGGPHSVGVSNPSTGTTYSTFTVTPTLSLDRLNAAPGDSITATGAGFAINETAITILIDVTSVATGVSADSEGSFTTSLIVPSLPSGSHSARASGPRTLANKVPPVTLTLGAGISLVQPDGPPGSVVEVIGSGFASNESVTVTAGNNVAGIAATANSRGVWQANVTIPAAPTGRLTIKAYGSGGVLVETDFTVSPTISMVGTGGEPGAMVMVKGAGFVANETGIRLILDGDVVASGISASTEGSWNGSFSLPSVPTGSYILHASGSQTLGTSIPEINLAVSADLKLDLTSGPPGTTMIARGAGFKSGEIVTVTVGQRANNVNVVASVDGVWTANVVIPESPAGLLPIWATGASGQQMAASFTVTSSVSLSSPYGSPTSLLQIKGAGFGAERDIAVSFGPANIATSSTDDEGSWSVRVPIPESPAGDYSLTVSSLGGEQEVPFKITPSIVLSETHGEPGATLNLSGFGFASTERGISVTLNQEALISGISADLLGSWDVAFTVPAVSSDTYGFEASGPETSVASLPDEMITINPSLVVSPASGVPGSPISLTGSGFRSQERTIMISYDGTIVATGINADARGTFKSSFTVPPSTSGLHFISHSSAVALASGGPEASFQVVEGISINLTEGPPDSGLTVSGSGFTAHDPLISIIFDRDHVLVQAASDAQGSFTEIIQIPASPAGAHVIGARSSNLSYGTNPEQTFYVVPDVELSISSGNVGGSVEVVGLGFGSLAQIALSYDDELTETTAVADSSGSFSVEFPIPTSVHGDHTIKAVDEDGQGDKATFSVEDSAPAVAVLLNPDSGVRGGLFGGYRPSLDWRPIEDPSGVTYDLQIGTSPEFAEPILEKSGLDNASYVLLEQDALPRGTYFWRVRAVDGASNEAPWSESFVVKSGLMAPWVLIMLIMLGVLATGCGGYSYVYIRRRRSSRVGGFPEFARDVSVAPALPELGASPIPALRAPFRLALPAPSRRRRARTPEEQAQLQLVLDFMRSLPLIEVTYELKWMDELMDSAGGEISDVIDQVLNGQIELNYQPDWLRHPTYEQVRHILQGHEFLQRLDEYMDAVNDIALDTVSLVRQVDADVAASALRAITQGDKWRFDVGIVQSTLGWFRGVYLRQASARDYILVPVSGSDGETMVSLNGEDTTPFPGPILEYVEEEQAVQYRDLHIQIRSNYINSEEARSLAARMVSVDLLREQLNRNLAELGQAI